MENFFQGWGRPVTKGMGLEAKVGRTADYIPSMPKSIGCTHAFFHLPSRPAGAILAVLQGHILDWHLRRVRPVKVVAWGKS